MTRRWVLSLLLHHRGVGKDEGDGACRETRRRHRSRHPAAGPRARNENRILIHPVMKQLLWICAGLLLTFTAVLGAFHLFYDYEYHKIRPLCGEWHSTLDDTRLVIEPCSDKFRITLTHRVRNACSALQGLRLLYGLRRTPGRPLLHAPGRCTAPRAGRRFQTNLKISES